MDLTLTQYRYYQGWPADCRPALPDQPPPPSHLDGVLMACESTIRADLGELRTWRGLDALHLFREITAVHGRLCTRFDSRDFLDQAAAASAAQPGAYLWDSHLMRRLCLAALGDLDPGLWHTPDQARFKGPY
jgi:hypothetical protein